MKLFPNLDRHDDEIEKYFELADLDLLVEISIV